MFDLIKFRLSTLIIITFISFSPMLLVSKSRGETTAKSEIYNYIEQLKTHKYWRIRSKAASTLGNFNQDTNQDTNTIIPALITALNDQDEIVSLRATFSLIKIGSPAVPELIEILETENESVRASAEFALRKNGFDIYPILSNELTSSNQQVRSSATSIFLEMAKDIEGRPISQKPSILELKQAVSALETAVKDIREFLKLQNPLTTNLPDQITSYNNEDIREINKYLVSFRAEIREHYLTKIRRGIFLSLTALILIAGLILWSRPEILLRWSRARLQSKQNKQILDQLLAEVQHFWQQVGATTNRQGKRSLQITSTPGRLNSYTPLPVILAIEKPIDQDVTELVQYAGKMQKSDRHQAGILLYQEAPDTLFRMRMAEVRLRDRFVLIPIPITAIAQTLREKGAASGLLAQYSDRYLPGADLFDDRNAIGDTLSFFGRGEILQNLAENLGRGQGIGIFGLRKSGKTSLLLQLGFAMQKHPLVHIDLQPYGGKLLYGAELFNQILSKLSQLLHNSKSHPTLELFASDRPASTLTSDFTQQLANFTTKLHEAGYQLPILIFLDEIERILPTETDKSERAEEFNAFFGALRAISQEKRSLSILIADVHPDANRINQWSQTNVPTNPVFNFFKEVFVIPFSSSETTRMLADIGELMGVTFDGETLTTIHRDSGGHPFVSRQLASLLYKKLAAETKKKEIQFTNAQRYLSKPFTYSGVLKDYFGQNIWGDLEKRQFLSAMAIIKLLTCNETETGISQPTLLKKLEEKFTESQCLDALLWLEAVGLVVRQELGDNDNYRMKVPLLSQWLRMQMKQEEIQQWQIL